MAPSDHPLPSGNDLIGVVSELTIRQSFTKDSEDASLSFTVTRAMFDGLDPSPSGDDEGPRGHLLITVSLYKDPSGLPVLFAYSDYTELMGLGRSWKFDAEHMFFEVFAGALDQPFVSLRLSQPFTQARLDDLPAT